MIIRELRTPAARIGAAGVLFVAAALLVRVGRGLTFFSDEWTIIGSRLDWNVDAFLLPHNEHLMLVPVMVFKPLLATVGLEHYWPYRLTVIAVHLLCVGLLFVYARRRHGDLVAACMSAPLLVFGAAWEVVLWPINIGFAGSMAAAVGAILCLDRDDRRGDVGASVLVALAIASSAAGIALGLGVLVEVLWDHRRWRRVWVAVVPFALYGAWFLIYGDRRVRQAPLEFADAPWYALQSASAAVGGYLGIGTETLGSGGGLVRASMVVLTVALVVTGVWLAVRRGRLTGRVAMLTVTLGSYWSFLAVSRSSLAEPYVSRYIYPGAVLAVLLAVQLLPAGVRWRAPVRRATMAGAALVVFLGAIWLRDGGARYRETVHVLRIDLASLEVARGVVRDDFRLDGARAYGLSAGTYFAAVDRLGSPAGVTPSLLQSQGEPFRRQADATLMRAYTVRPIRYVGAARILIDAERGSVARPHVVRVTGARVVGDGTCAAIRPTAGLAHVEVVLPPAGVLVLPAAGGRATLGLTRFATGLAAARRWTVTTPVLLKVPKDRSPVPWRVRLSVKEAARIC